MPEKFYLCRALLIRINRGSVTQGHSLQAQPLENDRFVGPLGAGRQKRDQRGDTEPRARLRPLPGIRTEPAGPKPQHGRIENHRTDPPLDFGHLLRPHRRPDRVGSRAGRLLADDRRLELRARTGKRPDTAFQVKKRSTASSSPRPTLRDARSAALRRAAARSCCSTAASRKRTPAAW